jgi:hypothetical protein
MRLIPRDAAPLERRNIAQTHASSAFVGPSAFAPSWDASRASVVQTREALVAAVTSAVAHDVGDTESFPIKAKQLGTDKDVTDTSPFAFALNVAPNQGLTAAALRQFVSLALDYGGEAYLVEVGATLTPLVGGRVDVVPAAPGSRNRDGSPAVIAGYLVRNAAGVELGRYDAEGFAVSGMAEGRLHRVHLPRPGDPFRACGLIEQAAIPIDVVHYGRLATRALLQNAGQPAGIIQILDETATTEQLEAFDRKMNSRLSDVTQKGRTLVVGSDVKYTQLGDGSPGSGWSELTAQAREDLMSVWAMPESRLSRGGARTYENQRVELAAYYRHTVLARLNLICSVFSQVTRAQGYVLFVDTSGVDELNDDLDTAAARAAALWQAGIATRDEARALAGLPPLATADGDAFNAPAVPASPSASPPGSAEGRDAVPFPRAAEAAPQKASPDGYLAAYDAAVTDAEEAFATFAQGYHARLYRNIVGRFERQARLQTRADGDPAPSLDPDDLIDVDARNAELAADLPGLLAGEMNAVVSAAGEFVGVALDPGLPRWQRTLARRVSRLIEGGGEYRGWTQTLQDEVAEAVRAGYAGGESVGQIAARIAGALDVDPADPKAVRNRALTIARTEVNGLANDTALGAFEESGVVASKRWYSIADNRSRESHVAANGQTVPLAAKFTVGGVQMDRPHDPAAPAREVVACRCRMLPVVEDRYRP